MNKYDDEQELDYVSKTKQKNEAVALKKFGLELTYLTEDKLSKLPVSEVTLKSLLDYKKITSNLAKKRHLMFVGKCLRNESEEEIRKHLENQLNAQLKKKDNPQNSRDALVNQLIEQLIEGGDKKIEALILENSYFERQKLRQILRNINSANSEQKKEHAVNKMKVYLNENILK